MPRVPRHPRADAAVVLLGNEENIRLKVELAQARHAPVSR
jgi:hypothetical protein